MHGGNSNRFCIKALDIPWWYYLISLLIVVLVARGWRWEGGLLVGYAFLVLAETVLIRKPFTGDYVKLEILWSWRAWETQRTQILTNLIMFVPVGVLAGWIWKWKGLCVAAGLSVIIEVLQLLTARGLCEFDDVIHNCLGTAVGIGIVMLIEKISRVEETE